MAELVRPGGCRLHVETHGDPKALPLVLLEGMGGDLPGWSRTIPNLAGLLFVVAFDFRGNGWSDAPDEPMTMATFVDDTVAVLDALGIDRAWLYGQSFGGMVALEMVLARPDRVLGLIVAATHSGGRSVVPVGRPAGKGEAATAIFSPGYASSDPRGVRELFESGVQQASHARRRQWEAMQEYDVSGRLGEVEVPTLVLHGTEDRVIDAGNASVLAEGIPGAELVLLSGAGHVYHWEQAQAAGQAVLDFVGRPR